MAFFLVSGELAGAIIAPLRPEALVEFIFRDWIFAQLRTCFAATSGSDSSSVNDLNGLNDWNSLYAFGGT